jgi:hypothetical protein
MNRATILRYTIQRIPEVTAGLTAAEWALPNVCGTWSTLQVVGHLVGWAHYYEEFLAPFAGQPIPTPYMDAFRTTDEHTFNERYGSAASSRTPDELMAAYATVFQRITALAAAIPDEVWHKTGTLPWSQEGSLEDFLVYGYYGHHYEHAAQIEVFRDRLRRGL